VVGFPRRGATSTPNQPRVARQTSNVQRQRQTSNARLQEMGHPMPFQITGVGKSSRYPSVRGATNHGPFASRRHRFELRASTGFLRSNYEAGGNTSVTTARSRPRRINSGQFRAIKRGKSVPTGLFFLAFCTGPPSRSSRPSGAIQFRERTSNNSGKHSCGKSWRGFQIRANALGVSNANVGPENVPGRG